MRSYGVDANGQWHEMSAATGYTEDDIYLTELVHAFKLVLGESPFFADVGIPQQETIISQIHPDFYVDRIRQFFTPFFSHLVVTKLPLDINNPDPALRTQPRYNVNAMTKQGRRINRNILV